MLRDNFKYKGPNDAAAEFVETVNQLAKFVNNFQVDLGVNGGTDVARTEQKPNGFKVDLTRLYIPPDNPV